MATQLPLDFVIEQFHPDLSATRLFFAQYSVLFPPEQLQPLLTHYSQLLDQQLRTTSPEDWLLWLEMGRVFAAPSAPRDDAPAGA